MVDTPDQRPHMQVFVRPDEFTSEHSRLGLCSSCTWLQVVTTSRERRFYLCRQSTVDPSFAKYPQLPVLVCSGWKPIDAGTVSSYTR